MSQLIWISTYQKINKYYCVIGEIFYLSFDGTELLCVQILIVMVEKVCWWYNVNSEVMILPERKLGKLFVIAKSYKELFTPSLNGIAASVRCVSLRRRS